MDCNNPFVAPVVRPEDMLSATPYSAMIALPKSPDSTIAGKCQSRTCTLLGDELSADWGYPMPHFRYRVSSNKFATAEAAVRFGEFCLAIAFKKPEPIQCEFPVLTVLV